MTHTRSRAGSGIRSSSSDDETRSPRKQRTREALMDASLRLLKEGRSFNSLSLREVTREAGIVPTAFYRHFRTMDELGLALVENGGEVLRRMLRDARRDGIPLTDAIRASVLIYRRYVEEHRLQFLFIAGERGGGSPIVRSAIRAEVQRFVGDMAQDLYKLKAFPQLSMSSLEMLAGLVVNTMLNAAIDILDLALLPMASENALIETFVRQIRLIFLGARNWREKPAGTEAR